eukprot:COSAG02_NODE_44961_length_361_cov_0.988550_1_plen_21_part_01
MVIQEEIHYFACIVAPLAHLQ